MVVTDDVDVAAASWDAPAGDRAVRFRGTGGTLVLTVAADVHPGRARRRPRSRGRPTRRSRAIVDAAVRTALTAEAELLGRGRAAVSRSLL